MIRPCSCLRKLPCWGSSYPTLGTLSDFVRSTCAVLRGAGGRSGAPLPCLGSHLTPVHWCPAACFSVSPFCPLGAHMAGRWAAPIRAWYRLISAQSMRHPGCYHIFCRDWPLGKRFLIFFCVCSSLAEENCSHHLCFILLDRLEFSSP